MFMYAQKSCLITSSHLIILFDWQWISNVLISFLERNINCLWIILVTSSLWTILITSSLLIILRCKIIVNGFNTFLERNINRLSTILSWQCKINRWILTLFKGNSGDLLKIVVVTWGLELWNSTHLIEWKKLVMAACKYHYSCSYVPSVQYKLTILKVTRLTHTVDCFLYTDYFLYLKEGLVLLLLFVFYSWFFRKFYFHNSVAYQLRAIYIQHKIMWHYNVWLYIIIIIIITLHIHLNLLKCKWMSYTS